MLNSIKSRHPCKDTQWALNRTHTLIQHKCWHKFCSDYYSLSIFFFNLAHVLLTAGSSLAVGQDYQVRINKSTDKLFSVERTIKIKRSDGKTSWAHQGVCILPQSNVQLSLFISPMSLCRQPNGTKRRAKVLQCHVPLILLYNRWHLGWHSLFCFAVSIHSYCVKYVLTDYLNVFFLLSQRRISVAFWYRQ